MPQPVDVFVRELGDAEAPVLVILHGLLGSSDNWQTLARSYAETHRVLLFDARNHGRSPYDDEHSYLGMVADLLHLLDGREIARASLIGHSMGGKTVLEFARLHPDRCDRLVVADMAARSYPIHHDLIFKALRSAPIDSSATRESVEEHLLSALRDSTVVAFLMKGLRRRVEGGRTVWSWRPNLSVLHAALPEVVRAVPLEMSTLPLLSIHGGQSAYVGEADLALFESHFLQFESHCISEAGHWLHAENPAEFFEVTRDFLN